MSLCHEQTEDMIRLYLGPYSKYFKPDIYSGLRLRIKKLSDYNIKTCVDTIYDFKDQMIVLRIMQHSDIVTIWSTSISNPNGPYQCQAKLANLLTLLIDRPNPINYLEGDKCLNSSLECLLEE